MKNWFVIDFKSCLKFEMYVNCSKCSLLLDLCPEYTDINLFGVRDVRHAVHQPKELSHFRSCLQECLIFGSGSSPGYHFGDAIYNNLDS